MSGITAILPAFNEEVSIGSGDHTAEVAGLAGAEVIRHPKNREKGVALKTGFESLNGAEVIVTVDTDNQQNRSRKSSLPMAQSEVT